MKTLIATTIALVTTATLATADSTTYVGSGDESWSIGHIGKNGFGIDIGNEGTVTDWTTGSYGQETSGYSVNLVYGNTSINEDGLGMFYGALLGARETSRYCSYGTSNLGYECYADTSSSSDYDINYGAIVGVSYKGWTVGARATGESTQTIIGYSAKF